MKTQMLAEKLSEYEGQNVAIWCVRYTYKGVVKEVGEDYVVLSNAYAVEDSDSATAPKPKKVDRIPSDLVISLLAVEIVCQPTWVFNDE